MKLLRPLQIGLLAFIGAVAPVTIGQTTDSPKAFDLGAHRGKIVLVDFWASWCVPCRQSFPWLNEMQAKYPNRLVIIGVNVDREHADAVRFLKDTPARFDIVFDPLGSLAAAYEVPGMPSSYVFDTNGTLVAKHIGFRSAARSEREAQLQALLADFK